LGQYYLKITVERSIINTSVLTVAARTVLQARDRLPNKNTKMCETSGVRKVEADFRKFESYTSVKVPRSTYTYSGVIWNALSRIFLTYTVTTNVK
jgi:hypothetical protein